MKSHSLRSPSNSTVPLPQSHGRSKVTGFSYSAFGMTRMTVSCITLACVGISVLQRPDTPVSTDASSVGITIAESFVTPINRLIVRSLRNLPLSVQDVTSRRPVKRISPIILPTEPTLPIESYPNHYHAICTYTMQATSNRRATLRNDIQIREYCFGAVKARAKTIEQHI